MFQKFKARLSGQARQTPQHSDNNKAPKEPKEPKPTARPPMLSAKECCTQSMREALRIMRRK